MNERYVRGSYPELLNSRRPRLVSIESRGVDITPGRRVEQWAERRIRTSLPHDPPVPPPDYVWEAPKKRRHFDIVDWAAAILILSLVFAGAVAVYVLATDPVGAGRFVSGGECRYPEYCQVAAR